jgi:predicted RNase H-like nuclease (RuvC/YqgF family)
MSDDLVKRLWESDEASALTNQAARRIEELERGFWNLHQEYDNRGDRIEERDDIIRHDRERIEELVSMVNSKADRIEELEDKLANIAHAVWTEHKDWEGERKYALRQIVKWLVRADRD